MDNDRWSRMMDMLEKLLERQSSPPAINVNVVLPDGKRKRAEPDKALNDEANVDQVDRPQSYPRKYIS